VTHKSGLADNDILGLSCVTKILWRPVNEWKSDYTVTEALMKNMRFYYYTPEIQKNTGNTCLGFTVGVVTCMSYTVVLSSY
jgi:hypothetical protein